MCNPIVQRNVLHYAFLLERDAFCAMKCEKCNISINNLLTIKNNLAKYGSRFYRMLNCFSLRLLILDLYVLNKKNRFHLSVQF